MDKIFFLIVMFVVAFVLQQSNFIVEKKVTDPRLGVKESEYHISWDNLKSYIQDIPEKVKDLFPSKSKRRHR